MNIRGDLEMAKTLKNQKKKLNLSEIKKMDKKLDKKKVIEILGYTVEMDKTFRSTSITDLITEFMTGLVKIDEEKKNVNKMIYLYSLILKYFTDIDIPEELDEQIEMTKLMIDNNIFQPIINEVEEEELKKIIDSIKLLNENLASQALLEEKEVDGDGAGSKS